MAVSDERYDIILDGLGFVLANKGIAESGRQANPYAAKISIGPTEHSDQDIWATASQTTWDRGRGEAVFEDEGRFFDAYQVDTRIRQQFILGPLKHYSNSGTGCEYPPMPTQEDIGTDASTVGFQGYSLGKVTDGDKVFMGIAQQIEVTRQITKGTTCSLNAGTKVVTDASATYTKEEVKVGDPIRFVGVVGTDPPVATTLDTTITAIADDTHLTVAESAVFEGSPAYEIGVAVTSVSVFMRKHKAPAQTITLRIETDNANSPSGTLVSENASATISSTSVAQHYAYVTTAFTPFNLLPSTAYWIVVQCDTAKADITNSGWYQVGYNWHKNVAANNPYNPPTESIPGYMYRTVGDTVAWAATGGRRGSMFFRINEGGALAGDAKWIREFKPTSSANSVFLCGTYDSVNNLGHVYYWDTTNKTWIETRPSGYTKGWTGNVTDVAVYDGKLFVAQGGSNHIFYISPTVTGDTWEPSSITWVDSGVEAIRLCVHAGYLWRADNVNQVTYASSFTNNSTADWSPATDTQTYLQVGTTHGQITNMVSAGQNLYIGKQNGLFVIKVGPPDSSDASPVIDLTSLWSSDNFKGMVYWNGSLFFNVKHAIYRFASSGVWDNVGPTNDAGLPDEERGKPVFFLATPTYLYAAIDAGAEGRSSILCYNGRGWHHIVEADKIGDRILAMGYNFNDNPDRLWFSEGGKLRYINMPEQSDNPYTYTDMHYAENGWLITSKIDCKMPDLDKEWFEVKVESDNIQAESRLCFGYSTTEATSTTLTDDAPVVSGSTTSTFATLVQPGDIVKDIEENEYYVTAVDSPSEHTLTLSPALASGKWGDASHQYYEVHASSLVGRDTAGSARWCEVDYRIDNENDNYWTYLGLVDDSPVKKLQFPETTNIAAAGVALPSMVSVGRGHTKNKIWLTTADTPTLAPLYDWIYLNGEYRQIASVDDTAETGYHLVTFVVPLTTRPSVGDIVYPGMPWGKFIQLRFNLYTGNKNNTPRIRSWTLKYLADIRDKKLFQFTIENARHIPLRHIPDDTRTLQEVFDQLDTINRKGRCALETAYGSWTVRPIDWRWSTVEKKQDGERWLVKQYHYMTLVEI